MTKSKVKSIDPKPGGSYVKDPETGETKLVSQTQQRVVTRLDESQAVDVSTATVDGKKSNKGAKS